MAVVIDGNLLANNIASLTAKKIKKLAKKGITPKLAVVLVGDNKASAVYVNKKQQAAKKLGIDCEVFKLPKNIREKELLEKMSEIQQDPGLSGIIVQLPLPEKLYSRDILNAVRPEFDVDCLTEINLGKLFLDVAETIPPTPAAVLEILKSINVSLAGKNITLLGVGSLVGKPLAVILMNKGASVTTVNSRTQNAREKCLSADIIITGVGKKNILLGNMVKKGAIVIDTGFYREGDKIFGDVCFEEVKKRASFITPTPGGVGPITVAKLLWNTALCAENILKLKNR